MSTVGGASWETAGTLTAGETPPTTRTDLVVGTTQPYWAAWWTLSVDAASTVTLDSSPSPGATDTYLKVFTGSTYAGRTLVAENDDTIGYEAVVSFDAEPGVTYHVALGSYSTSGGDVTTYVLDVNIYTPVPATYGRRRTGYAVAVVEAPMAAPAVVPPYSMARALALPPVTYIDGRPEPVEPTIATEPRLRQRVIIDGVDVTWLRDVPTRCTDFELLEPFGFGSGTISLPQVNPGEDFSALPWLAKGKKVRIDLVDPATDEVVIPGHYRGITTRIETTGPDVTLHVDGDLSGRAAMQHRPAPLFERLGDIGRFVYQSCRDLRTPFTPRYGPVTGVKVSNRSNGGGQDQLAWLSFLCTMGQQGSTQYTVMPVADGTRREYEYRAKDRDTIAGTVYFGAPGVSVQLTDDMAEQPTDIYGNGTHPTTGQRWLNGIYPGLQPAPAPTYPFTDNRTFGLGTTDADTDTGDGITVLTDKLAGTGFLAYEDKGTVYTDDVADAVRELRKKAGLANTDTVNTNVWNALFDVGVTGFTLRGAGILPLVRIPETTQFFRTANGSVSGKNPAWDYNRIEVHRNIDFGVIRRKNALAWAQQELERASGVNLVGEISLETDLVAGDHTYGDPVEVLQATSLKAGTNVKLVGYQGTDVVFHVAYVRHNGTTVTLGVDTQARDALHIGQIVERNREARRNPAREWIRTHRRSTSAPDALVGWSEIGGQVYTKQLLDGRRWNVIPVVAGQEGTISRLRVKLQNSHPRFVVAVFGFRVTRGGLAKRIGNPFNTNGDGESKWTSEGVQDWLHDKKLLLYAAGDDNQPCGYYPRSHRNDAGDVTSAPLTGVWRDDASFAYRTFRDPVLYLAIWPDRDCEMPAQRVFWPQMDDGI